MVECTYNLLKFHYTERFPISINQDGMVGFYKLIYNACDEFVLNKIYLHKLNKIPDF